MRAPRVWTLWREWSLKRAGYDLQALQDPKTRGDELRCVAKRQIRALLLTAVVLLALIVCGAAVVALSVL